MVVKKHKYVVQHFVGILIGLFSAAFLYSALVLLLAPHTFLVRIISMIYLTLLGVGIWYVIRLYSRHFLQSEQIMRLYAMGYTIEDICQLEWYASRGTEMALTKAMELLDRGWYTVSGTDLHNRVMLAKAGGMKLKKKVLERLEQLEEQKSF